MTKELNPPEKLGLTQKIISMTAAGHQPGEIARRSKVTTPAVREVLARPEVREVLRSHFIDNMVQISRIYTKTLDNIELILDSPAAKPETVASARQDFIRILKMHKDDDPNGETAARHGAAGAMFSLQALSAAVERIRSIPEPQPRRIGPITEYDDDVS